MEQSKIKLFLKSVFKTVVISYPTVINHLLSFPQQTDMLLLGNNIPIEVFGYTHCAGMYLVPPLEVMAFFASLFHSKHSRNIL